MIREVLVSVGVGEEEELYLFDSSEHDFDGLSTIHRIRKAGEGRFDFLEARFTIQPLEAYDDGGGIVVPETAASHSGGVVRFIDRPLQHLFECGADVLECIA